MCVRLRGAIATLAMPCWCGAQAEGMLLVSWGCDVRGAGGAGLPLCSRWMRAVLFHSGVCLVRSFGCLKHLSNTLGTAH